MRCTPTCQSSFSIGIEELIHCLSAALLGLSSGGSLYILRSVVRALNKCRCGVIRSAVRAVRFSILGARPSWSLIPGQEQLLRGSDLCCCTGSFILLTPTYTQKYTDHTSTNTRCPSLQEGIVLLPLTGRSSHY